MSMMTKMTKGDSEVVTKDYSFSDAIRQKLVPEWFSIDALNRLYSENAEVMRLPQAFPSFVGLTDVENGGGCFFHVIRALIDTQEADSSVLRKACLDFIGSNALEPHGKAFLRLLIGMESFKTILLGLLKDKAFSGAGFLVGRTYKDKFNRSAELIQTYCASKSKSLAESIGADRCNGVTMALTCYLEEMANSAKSTDDVIAMAACQVIERQIVVYSCDFRSTTDLLRIHCSCKDVEVGNSRLKYSPIYVVQVSLETGETHYLALRISANLPSLQSLSSLISSHDSIATQGPAALSLQSEQDTSSTGNKLTQELFCYTFSLLSFLLILFFRVAVIASHCGLIQAHASSVAARGSTVGACIVLVE